MSTKPDRHQTSMSRRSFARLAGVAEMERVVAAVRTYMASGV